MKNLKLLFSLFLLLFAISINSLALQEDKSERGLSVHPERMLVLAAAGVEQEQVLASLRAELGNDIEIVHVSGLEGYILDWAGNASLDVTKVKSLLSPLIEVSWMGEFIRDAHDTQVAVLNRFFVKVKPGYAEEDVREGLHGFAYVSLEKSSFHERVFTFLTTEKLFDSRAFCSRFEQAEAIEYAEPDYLFFPIVNGTATDDDFYSRQWHLENDGSLLQGGGEPGADISAVDAWEFTRGSADVLVAVMDSGIDTMHQDLQANLLPGRDFTNDDAGGHPILNFPEDGHGTCCAGIIAAEADNEIGVAGVAPETSIMSCRVFKYIELNDEVLPISTASYFADGITYAAMEAGAHVQSHSWSLPDDFVVQLGDFESVEDAIRNAVNNGRNGMGCSLLFSSGNDDVPVYWPGTLPEAISVTATSMCDERKSPSSCDGEPWGGHFGPLLDLGAPGVQIATTDAVGGEGYSNSNYTMSFNGTSAACPIAAGTLALIYAMNPDLTQLEAREVLLSTCDKVGEYEYDVEGSYGTRSNDLGYGRVNAATAVFEAFSFPASTARIAVNQLTVYPNPASMQLTIDYPGAIGEAAILSLRNLQGQIVFQEQINFKGQYHLQLPLSPPPGLYFLELSNTREVSICRVVFSGL